MNQARANQFIVEITRKCNLTHLVDDDKLWYKVNLPRENASYKGTSYDFILNFLNEDEIKCIVSIAEKYELRYTMNGGFLSIYTPRIQ